LNPFFTDVSGIPLNSTKQVAVNFRPFQRRMCASNRGGIGAGVRCVVPIYPLAPRAAAKDVVPATGDLLRKLRQSLLCDPQYRTRARGSRRSRTQGLSMLDLHNPELDWIKLASGMGVEASRSTSVEEFARRFASAMKDRGPRLIAVVV
jgi:hypothetical protein